MGFGHVDYIVTSKRVFTSAVGDDAARPLAFAVVGDRIEFMGTPADVIAACAPGTPVLDFGDAFICPGFHDAHLHFFHTALGASPYLLMHMGESEAELVESLSLIHILPSGGVVMLLSLMVSSSSLVIRQDSRGRAGADATEG